MRNVRPSAVTAAAVLFPLSSLLFVACTVPGDNLPPETHDLSVFVSDGGGVVDLSRVDLSHPAGTIGLGCAQDTDCKLGTAPSCWQTNVLNDEGNLATPGGYCSSTCNGDKDCGGLGICQPVDPNNLAQGYCLESCSDENTCRHPGFACLATGTGGGYCWPASRLTCNPTAGSGTCLDTDGNNGGCIRRAFEDLGECHTACNLGVSQCPFTAAGKSQHCVYINATRDTSGRPTRDKFNGTACFQLYDDAKPEGVACSFFDECQDGFQCNLSPGGDGKCHLLCKVDVVDSCGSDTFQGKPTTCKDVFAAGPGNPGLCLPQ